MAGGKIDKLAQSIMQGQGFGGAIASDGNPSSRIVYPAIVVNNGDPLDMKRITARIISIDNEGNLTGGRDRDTPDDQLPLCIPMIPNHFHIVPLVDEMVYVILENPTDNSAPRYYIGSQINSQYKLRFQQYIEANRVFKKTSFNLNKSKSSNPEAATIFPKEGDIALQGRNDADVILKPREVFLVAGKFEKGTNSLNITSPGSFQLIQKENAQDEILELPGGISLTAEKPLIPRYSQTNLTSSNVNIYSHLGKFRESSLADFEINEDLKSFGELADTLHPAVFGDELIKLLDLIVRVMLNHIHTPQEPLVTFTQPFSEMN
jgi:hypothetical protein